MRFRVATYNIHKCRGMDWRVRPERIAAVLGQLDADIIALQEVLSDQTQCLARKLKLSPVFAAARIHRGRGYGNVLFTRFPVTRTENHDITVTGREERKCLEAEIQIPGRGALHVFAVHLGTSWIERRQQARKLLTPALLGRSDSEAPSLLLGDFNEWTAGVTTRLLSAHLQSVNVRSHLGRARTYPGLLPFLHLDHIYYDRDLHLIHVRLLRTPLSLIASDHLPLIADFEW